MGTQESQKVVYAALAANLGIAISKFVVAGVTGSPAMLTEGIHSTVDTGNEMLLLLGARNSRKPADRRHPFGYGKAMYFWALIVALSVFSMGGGVSIYHGILSFRNPPPLEDATWNYVVLILAGLFEGYSWNVSRKELNEHRRRGENLWQTFRRSKDASVVTIFIEDSAAILGIVVALVGIWLGHLLGNPKVDPIASILIGVILVAAALVLARKTGGLLIGESMDFQKVEHVRKMISSEPMVEFVGDLQTMQLGPDSILLAATVRFRRNLRIDEVDQAIHRLEKEVRTAYPKIQRIYFEAEKLRSSFEGSVDQVDLVPKS